MIIDQAQTYRDKIIELLAAEKLPVNDLPETLDNFIVAIQNGEVVGVGGIEVTGTTDWFVLWLSILIIEVWGSPVNC